MLINIMESEKSFYFKSKVSGADCDLYYTNVNEGFFITVQRSISHDLQGGLSHYPFDIMALESILTIPETLLGKT